MSSKKSKVKVTVLFILAVFCVTGICTYHASVNAATPLSTGETSGVIPAASQTKAFVASKAATTPIENPPERAPKDAPVVLIGPPIPLAQPIAPVPPTTGSLADWQKYFTDFMAYVATLTGADRATAWQTFMTSVTDYLKTDAFKSLSGADKTAYMLGLMNNVLTPAAQNNLIDDAALTKGITAVYQFLTQGDWNVNDTFKALTGAQQQGLLNAFANLAAKVISDTGLSADTKGNVTNIISRVLISNMREAFRNKAYTLDFSAFKTSAVATINQFMRSDDFKKLSSDDARNGVIWTVTQVAVELGWRPEDVAANGALLTSIIDSMNKVLTDYKTNDKVVTSVINNMANLFRIVNWRNYGSGDGSAGSIWIHLFANWTQTDFNNLVNTLETDDANTAIDVNTRCELGLALCNLLMHNNDIKTYTANKLSIADVGKAKQNITAMLQGMIDPNNALATAGWWERNGFIHLAGGNVLGLIGSTDATDKALVDAYVAFAKDSLSRAGSATDNTGNYQLQTSAINVLTMMLDIATKAKDNARATEVAGQIKTAFGSMSAATISVYIQHAGVTLASLTGMNADAGAWYSAALMNLARFNLANHTGKMSTTDIMGLVRSVKGWVTDQKNLDDMRVMAWQKFLFDSIAELLKEIYKQGDTTFSDQEKTDLQQDVLDTFTMVQKIKDPLVLANAYNAGFNLSNYLRANGYADFAAALRQVISTTPRAQQAMAKLLAAKNEQMMLMGEVLSY